MINLLKTFSLHLTPTKRDAVQILFLAVLLIWLFCFLGECLSDDLQCHALGYQYGYTNPVTFNGYCEDDMYGYIPMDLLRN